MSQRVEMYEAPPREPNETTHRHRVPHDGASEALKACGAPLPNTNVKKQVNKNRDAIPHENSEFELGSAGASLMIDLPEDVPLRPQRLLPAWRRPNVADVVAAETGDAAATATGATGTTNAASTSSLPDNTAPSGDEKCSVTDSNKAVQDGAELALSPEDMGAEHIEDQTLDRADHTRTREGRSNDDADTRTQPRRSFSSSPRRRVLGTVKQQPQPQPQQQQQQQRRDSHRRLRRDAKGQPSLLRRLLSLPGSVHQSNTTLRQQEHSDGDCHAQGVRNVSIAGLSGRSDEGCPAADEAHGCSTGSMKPAERRDERDATASPSAASCGSFLASRELGAVAVLLAPTPALPRSRDPAPHPDNNSEGDPRNEGEARPQVSPVPPPYEAVSDQHISPNRDSEKAVQGDIKSTQIVGSEPDAHMFILDKMAALWDRQLGPLEQRQRDLEQQVRRLKEELRKSQVRERAEKEALARERADHAAMAALQTEKLATSETALIEAVAKQKGTTLERDLLQSRVAELERANQSLVEASRKISEENRNLVAYRAAVLEATLSSTRHTGATAAADSAIQVAHDPQNPSDRTYCAVSQG